MSEVIKAQYTGISFGGREKRNFPRFYAKLPILIKDPISRNNIFVLEVSSEDISSKGVRIASSHILQPHARLELLVRVRDREELLRLYGEIMWVKECVDNKWQAGVSFYSSTADFLEKIQG